MFEIIIIAIIIFIVVKKKKENGAGGNTDSARDTIQTTTAPAHRMPKPGRTSVPPAPQNTMSFGSSANRNPASSGSFSQQGTAIPASVQQQEESTGSTTAYLNEKAKQDAIEHAREDREEEIRLNKAYGGLRVAERLYEGDSVPQGRRLCVCGYCGAENLLPMVAREHFCCYFCREPLA